MFWPLLRGRLSRCGCCLVVMCRLRAGLKDLGLNLVKAIFPAKECIRLRTSTEKLELKSSLSRRSSWRNASRLIYCHSNIPSGDEDTDADDRITHDSASSSV